MPELTEPREVRCSWPAFLRDPAHRQPPRCYRRLKNLMAHPAIIDRDMFDAAQAIAAKRRTAGDDPDAAPSR
jgi:hypothetical protein